MPTMVARRNTNWIGLITVGVVVAAGVLIGAAALSRSRSQPKEVPHVTPPVPQTAVRLRGADTTSPPPVPVSEESSGTEDVAALRDENASLRAALEEAQADADRYRKGLEQAVAELNRVSATRVTVEAPKPRSRGALYAIRGPRVIPMGASFRRGSLARFTLRSSNTRGSL